MTMNNKEFTSELAGSGIHRVQKLNPRIPDVFTVNIINCYDIFDIKEDVNNIIQRHDFYINTAGVVRKKVAN